MNLKTTFVIALCCALTLPVQAGLFFDDPVELEAAKVPHPIGKDELKFTPSGKCANFHVFQAEVQLELTYSTGKRTLFAQQGLWSRSSPLVIALPDGLSGLQSLRLTGKCQSMFRLKKGGNFNPNAEDKVSELAKNMEMIKGYKIDSKWVMN